MTEIDFKREAGRKENGERIEKELRKNWERTETGQRDKDMRRPEENGPAGERSVRRESARREGY